MSAPESLDVLLECVSSYGKTTLVQHDDREWRCWLEMYTTLPAVKVELKTTRPHKLPRDAVLEVINQAVTTINTFEFKRRTT